MFASIITSRGIFFGLSRLSSLILQQLVCRPPKFVRNATAAAAFFLLEVNYSITNISATHSKRQFSSDINMASLKEKVSNLTNPSALTVLTAMLFWGQVQNYMMRINLREERSHHHTLETFQN